MPLQCAGAVAVDVYTNFAALRQKAADLVHCCLQRCPHCGSQLHSVITSNYSFAEAAPSTAYAVSSCGQAAIS